MRNRQLTILTAILVIIIGFGSMGTLPITAMTATAAATNMDCVGAPTSQLMTGQHGAVTQTRPGRTSGPVNMRGQPTKAGEILAKLNDGDKFVVLDVRQYSGNRHGW